MTETFNDPRLQSILRQARFLSKQNVSAKERVGFRNIAEDTYYFFIQQLSQYIKKPLSMGALRRRFLLVDEPDFIELSKNYQKILAEGEYYSYFEEGEYVNAIQIPVGRNRFYLVRRSNPWDEIFAESQESIINIIGDKKQAIELVPTLAHRNTTAHEIAHLHQSDNLSFALMECGAYYYADLITSKMGIHITYERYQPWILFYKRLLKKYGADVHRVYFDIPRQSWHTMVINQEFQDDVIKRLFPNYRRIGQSSL